MDTKLISEIISDMKKELEQSFKGLGMYISYHENNYEDTSSFDIPDITIYYGESRLDIYHDDDINTTQITFECQDASTNNLEELSKVITMVGKYFAMIKI